MEALALLVLALVGVVVIGSILGMVAMAKVVRLEGSLQSVDVDTAFTVQRLEARVIESEQAVGALSGRLITMKRTLAALAQSSERPAATSVPEVEAERQTAPALAPEGNDEVERQTEPVLAVTPVVPGDAEAPPSEAAEPEPPGTVEAIAPRAEPLPAPEELEAPIADHREGIETVEEPDTALGPPTQPPAIAPSESMIVDAESVTREQVSEVSRPARGEVILREAAPLEREAPMDAWQLFEEKVGKRWITWAGALALFVGAALFVKHVVDVGWLGPWGRIGIALAFGVALVGVGVKNIARAKMRALGQGLIGGGLGVLYAATYAGYGYYDLFPHWVAFAVMVVVTLLGMGLSVGFDARPVAFLAVLGGFVTPLLLSRGVDPGHALFAYLFCLDLGVLGIAFRKRWRALDTLAMVGTAGLFAGWSMAYWEPGMAVARPLGWLTAYHLLFLALPFAHHLRHRTVIARERLAMALTSGCVVFGAAYGFLAGESLLLGGAAAILGVSYLVVAFAVHRRIPLDRMARLSLVTLSIAFLTLAVPMVLDFHAVTIAWAMEAILLLYLGHRYRYYPDRVFGAISLGLALGRVVMLEWPVNGAASAWPLFNVDLGSALVVALAAGLFALLHHRSRGQCEPWERKLGRALALGAPYLALAAVSTDLGLWMDGAGLGAAVPWSLALVWFAGAASIFAVGLGQRSVVTRVMGLLALVIGSLGVLWSYSLTGVDQGRVGIIPLLNGSFLTGTLALALILAVGLIYRRSLRCVDDERRVFTLILGFVLSAGTLLLSVEIWQSLAGNLALAQSTLALLWVVGAVACLAASVATGQLGLRWLGLAHLATAAALVVVGYEQPPAELGGLVVLNLHFLAAAGVAGALLAFGLVIRHEALEEGDSEGERLALGHALVGGALGLLLLAVSAECLTWLLGGPAESALRLAIPLIWLVGAAGFVALAFGLRSLGLRHFGLVALTVSALAATFGFGLELSEGAMLFINSRFLPAALVVAVLFAFGAASRRWGDDERNEEDQREGLFLYGLGASLAVTLLSVETYLFFTQTVADPAQGRWLAQMALSIIWASSAAVILAFGFKRQTRTLRLAGLGLFGATALKLVAVDTAQVDGGYRIASFLVVGCLMIGASYLYHRVERWVSEAQA